MLFNYSNNNDKDANARKDDCVIRILSFLDPISFLEASSVCKDWRRCSKAPQFARKNEEARAMVLSWNELKTKRPDIFSQKETHLSVHFQKITGGMTNISFRLKTLKGNFFLRIPGNGSTEHLLRSDEFYNAHRATQIGLNIEIMFFNPNTGLYFGEFIENGRRFSPDHLLEKSTMIQVAKTLKTLHSSKVMFKNTIDTFDRMRDLLNKIDGYGYRLPHNRKALKKRLMDLYKICSYDKTPYVPCHNDTTYLNFLYKGNELKLLDWEYSGNNKALFDLANFCVTSHVNRTSQQWLLQAYFGVSPDKQLWKIFDAYKQLTYVWYYLWAVLQIANKSGVVPESELMSMANSNWNELMSRDANVEMPPSKLGHLCLSSTTQGMQPYDPAPPQNALLKIKYPHVK